MKNWRRSLRYLFALSIPCALSQSNCFAQIYTWTNPAGGSFSSPGNWSPNGLPGSIGLTLFNLSNSYTVNFNYSPTNVGMIVNNGDVTFDIGVGNTYALASPISSAIGTTAGYSPTLTVTSGTLRFNLGQGDTGGPDSTGIATAAGGSGTLTITGSNSQLRALQAFDVGVAGTGTINALNDAYVSLGSNSYLGARAGSSGTIYANHSTIELGSGIVVGNAGFGEVWLNNNSTGYFGPNLTLGNLSGSIGKLTISASSFAGIVNAYTYGVTVGNSGVGIVNVTNGAWTNQGELAVGKDYGSNGTITLFNNGVMVQENGMIHLGGSSTGPGGVGVITVLSGGRLYASSSTAGISLKPDGTLNILDGGYVSANSLSTYSSGALNLAGGKLDIGSGGLDIGNFLQVNGELNITNGNFRVANLFRVGNGAAGSVRVQQGASDLSYAWIGFGSNSNGSFYTNSDFHAKQVFIGAQGGTGSLTLDGVTNPVLDLETYIGVGGNGTLNIKKNSVLDSRTTTIIGAYGGTAVVNNEGVWYERGNMEIGKSPFYAPALAQSATLNLSGLLYIDYGLSLYSPGTINLNGGLLSMDSFDPQGGVINFNEGTIRFTNQWNADYNHLTSILGSSHKLRSGQVIEVQDATTLQSYLELNGGILRTGSINGGSNLNFKSGQLQLTASNFIVGGGSSTLGSTVTLGQT
jgi:T5SS/PEP-CTERM-associated repeat protein